jgi:hypothetical protein
MHDLPLLNYVIPHLGHCLIVLPDLLSQLRLLPQVCIYVLNLFLQVKQVFPDGRLRLSDEVLYLQNVSLVRVRQLLSRSQQILPLAYEVLELQVVQQLLV